MHQRPRRIAHHLPLYCSRLISSITPSWTAVPLKTLSYQLCDAYLVIQRKARCSVRPSDDSRSSAWRRHSRSRLLDDGRHDVDVGWVWVWRRIQNSRVKYKVNGASCIAGRLWKKSPCRPEITFAVSSIGRLPHSPLRSFHSSLGCCTPSRDRPGLHGCMDLAWSVLAYLMLPASTRLEQR